MFQNEVCIEALIQKKLPSAETLKLGRRQACPELRAVQSRNPIDFSFHYCSNQWENLCSIKYRLHRASILGPKA